MPKFSLESLKTKRYSVTPPSTQFGTLILPVAPSRPRPSPNVSASQRTAQIRNVGVSSTAFDIKGVSDGFPDPNVDLGVMYSNGYRYQYLDFKGTEIGGCQIILPSDTVTVQVEDKVGITFEEITTELNILVTSYVGNAVFPPLPQNNVPTNNVPIPGKVPLVLNKTC
jgi:hypothetical protein